MNDIPGIIFIFIRLKYIINAFSYAPREYIFIYMNMKINEL
jgi:hypothetical protein